MKIKVVDKKYEEVLTLPKAKRHKPMKQHMLFRVILRIASSFDLWGAHFKCKKIGMEKCKLEEKIKTAENMKKDTSISNF